MKIHKRHSVRLELMTALILSQVNRAESLLPLMMGVISKLRRKGRKDRCLSKEIGENLPEGESIIRTAVLHSFNGASEH